MDATSTDQDTTETNVAAELHALSGKIDQVADQVTERQADYIGDQLNGNILKQEIADRLERIERHLGIEDGK